MTTKRVLLAGATGYLGQYIAKKLIEKEYQTRLIVRNKQKVSFDIEKLQIVEAQVTQQESIKKAFIDIDVVISTVGISKQKDGLTYMSVDFQANMNLLEEAKKVFKILLQVINEMCNDEAWKETLEIWRT